MNNRHFNFYRFNSEIRAHDGVTWYAFTDTKDGWRQRRRLNAATVVNLRHVAIMHPTRETRIYWGMAK